MLPQLVGLLTVDPGDGCGFDYLVGQMVLILSLHVVGHPAHVLYERVDGRLLSSIRKSDLAAPYRRYTLSMPTVFHVEIIALIDLPLLLFIGEINEGVLLR